MEDYYALLPQPLDLNSWTAWQFHDPKSGNGFVQVFRHNSREGKMQVALRGLTLGKSYNFTDPLGDAQKKINGADAMNGMTFSLEPMTSQIFEYEVA
jgi:hypothetical protein